MSRARSVIRRNFLLLPPKIEDLEAFNNDLLARCMVDLKREHYVKNERIIDLFNAEGLALIPLPRERFQVFTLEKGKTDGYSLSALTSNSIRRRRNTPIRSYRLDIFPILATFCPLGHSDNSLPQILSLSSFHYSCFCQPMNTGSHVSLILESICDSQIKLR